jgi:phosphatidylglycerophosphatase A
MRLGDKAILFLATAGPIGRAKRAPGTWGTLAAVPIGYLVGLLPLAMAAAITAGLIGFAIWIASMAEVRLGAKDPGAIVIDEMAGLLVAFLGHPFRPLTVVGLFLLFRLLDILKPFPIGYADKHLRGGTGVVMDDVLAGAAANLIWLVVRASGLA